MNVNEQIADHLRGVHFGANWTDVNLQDKLADVTWQQATTRVLSFHTIATLVFHMNYFVSATIAVLKGEPLEASDKFSFDGPPIASQADWDALLQKTWSDAEVLATLIERMPQQQLAEPFVDEQYGTCYRCLHGPIEHCHYHLGQIAVIKAILDGGDETATPDAKAN